MASQRSLSASQASLASSASFIPPSQKVRPKKKLLDQNQTREQKKEVTSEINAMSDEITTNRADLIADKDNAFQRQVDRVATVHDKVLHTAEAIKSINLVSKMSEILHTSVKQKFQSSKTHGIDINHWIRAILQNFTANRSTAKSKKRRKSAAADDAGAAPAAGADAEDGEADDDTSGTQQKRRKSNSSAAAAAVGSSMDEKHGSSAAAEDGADGEEDAFGDVDWTAVGREANKYIRSVPTPDFMVGPLSVEAKVRSKKAAELVKSVVGEVEHVEDASKSVLDEKSATDLRVKNLADQIPNRIEMWRLVTDPDPNTGFTATIENLFDLSFIIRDAGAAMIYDDPIHPHIPYITKQQMPAANDPAAERANPSQFVLNFDMKMWHKIVAAYGLTTAYLNRKLPEADEPLIPVSQLLAGDSSSASAAAPRANRSPAKAKRK